MCNLSAQSISLCYRSKIVLESFSHCFGQGTWTRIIGPNGAGKSTLIKSLCGLVPVSGGRILLGDRRIDQMQPAEISHMIAYVPQQLSFMPPLDAASFVAHGCYAAKLPTNEARQKAVSIMMQLGIAHLCDRRIDQLSGGEQQLCVLSSAIAQNTRILLLDEPDKGLDIQYRQKLRQILVDLRDQGYTLIESTHDLSIARQYADQTILLCDKTCLFQGEGFPSDELICQAYRLDANDSTSLERNNDKVASPLVRNASFIRIAAVLLLLCCLIVCPFVGESIVGPDDGLFWMLRVPRVIWGCVTGAVLAVVGALFQSLFQNALATPYTLGVASGASLGAMAAIQSGLASAFGISVAGCFGGILSMLAVIAIAAKNTKHPFYCLMAGVAVAMFCSAFGLIIQSFASPLTAQQMMRWQIGGFEIAGYSTMPNLIPILVGFAVLFKTAPAVDLVGVDADLAQSQGVPVSLVRTVSLLAAGIITSIVVSICGPIGFVGLVVPNAVRHLVGARLRHVMVLSALFGAVFLAAADMVSRVLERFAWIPAGVVTAIVGVPCFMLILFGQKRDI